MNRPPLPRMLAPVVAGAFVSMVGDGVMRVALPLTAQSLTDEAFAIGVIAAAAQLPWLLFGVRLGRRVDRGHPVEAMILADVVRGVALALLGVAIVADVVSLPAVIVTAFVLGLGDVVFSAGSTSLIPALVDDQDLPRANGRIEAAENAGDSGVGPLLGGWLFGIGRSIPFFFDAASFFLSAGLLRRARRIEIVHPPEDKSSGGSAVGWLLRQPALRGLVGFTMTMACFQATVMAIEVVLIVDEYGRSPGFFGLFIAITALGAVTGSAVAAAVWAKLGTAATLISLTGLTVAAYLLTGVVGGFWLATGCLLVATATGPIGNVVTFTLRQRLTPSGRRGEILNTFRLFVLGSTPIGAVLGGAGASLWGAGSTIAVAGIAVAVLAPWPLRTLIVALRQVPVVEEDEASR